MQQTDSLRSTAETFQKNAVLPEMPRKCRKGLNGEKDNASIGDAMLLLGFDIPDYVVMLIETMLVAFIAIFLALYVYAGFAVMAIAKKTNTPRPWLAFVPIANVYLMAKIGDLSGWYTASLALALIPFIGGFITTATFAYIWWKIAEKLHKPGWWGMLILIPVVNMIMIGVMAWGKETQEATGQDNQLT
jgi:hypothetical protein